MPCKPDFKNRTPEEKRRMKRTIAAIIAFAAFLAIACVLVGRPLLKFIDDPQKFRDWVDTHGIWGRLSFVGMMALQVIVAFIPGEPLEIAAGYACGVWEGTGLCMLGALIGGLVVFLFVRSFGRRAVEVFFPPEQIDSVRFLRAGRELNFLVFLLFFIPGTPKDVMTYCVGLTKMPLGTWLLISSTARIPSIVTSTIGGDALGLQNYQFALIAFGVAAALAAAGVLIYRNLNKKGGAG